MKKSTQDFIIYDKEHKVRNKMIDALNNEFDDIGFSFLLGGSIGIGIHPNSWDKTFCLKYLETENYSKQKNVLQKKDNTIY